MTLTPLQVNAASVGDYGIFSRLSLITSSIRLDRRKRKVSSIVTLVSSAVWTRRFLLPAYIICCSGLHPVDIVHSVSVRATVNPNSLVHCIYSSEWSFDISMDFKKKLSCFIAWWRKKTGTVKAVHESIAHLQDLKRWSRVDMTPSHLHDYICSCTQWMFCHVKEPLFLFLLVASDLSQTSMHQEEWP